jgi:putative membrane-bound dehydrogenase-like protein
MIRQGNSTAGRYAAAVAGIAGLFLAAAALRAGAQDDDLARELPRIKPLEVEAARKSFRLRPGFRLELVASEPLIADPVSVCYDADGRLYVVEMRGYPYLETKPSGQVVRLEDGDGDGRFETRTVFLDGLSWPTGIVPYDGGVFVAAAPEIVYAKDTSGDGVADLKRVMFTGFGTENVQGLLNGLLWGPDGWIYGVTSSNGGTIRNASRPDAPPVSVRGRDFRFRPDGSAFEAISGGGQFGHSFDDWGHRFTCNNSNHARQIVLPAHYLERNPALIPPPAVLDIAAEGPAAPVFRISPPEPWRVVRTRQRAADPELSKRLPPTELFATGFFTSATGITVYRGSAYPDEYRGNLFVGDVGGNLVHRKRLLAGIAAFQAVRADADVEFLASTDNWFRPVNFTNTPDGTLLVLDMYRETIEHPLSIPEPIKKHLDLTSGRDRGRLYNLIHVERESQGRRSPKLSRARSSELVAWLADPDGWWRETAQRLLIERRDRDALPLLRAMVRGRKSALGRLHAMWTLDCFGALDSPEIMTGLDDADPRIREQSIRLAESQIKHDPHLLESLAALASDPDPMVRLQLAFSLGEASGDPRALRALASIGTRDATSRWTRAAIASAIPGRASELLEALAKRPGFASEPAGGLWLDELADLAGYEQKDKVPDRLFEHLSAAGLDRISSSRILLGLATGLTRAGGSAAALFRGASSARVAELLTEAAHLVESARPPEERSVAIQLLGLLDVKKARALLPGLLDARQPTAVQLVALQSLSRIQDRESAQGVITRWRSMSPAVRREALESLISHRDAARTLIDAIATRRIEPSEIDPSRLAQLRSHPDPATRAAARKTISSSEAAAQKRGQVALAYRPALALEGDREKGRVVFEKLCSTCHQVQGRGTDVGPDLATVAHRSPDDLLLHVLEPNREVAPNYVNYLVVTQSGRIVSGIIAEERATSIVLRRALGATDVVPRDQIEEIASTGMSLMPEGLEKGLSQQDMADLISFLRSLGPAPRRDVTPAARK